MCRLGYSIYLPTRHHRDCLPKFCIGYVWLKVILISGEAKPFLRYMHFDLIEAIGCVFGDRLLRHVHCHFYDTLRNVAYHSKLTDDGSYVGPWTKRSLLALAYQDWAGGHSHNIR